MHPLRWNHDSSIKKSCSISKHLYVQNHETGVNTEFLQMYHRREADRMIEIGIALSLAVWLLRAILF